MASYKVSEIIRDLKDFVHARNPENTGWPMYGFKHPEDVKTTLKFLQMVDTPSELCDVMRALRNAVGFSSYQGFIRQTSLVNKQFSSLLGSMQNFTYSELPFEALGPTKKWNHVIALFNEWMKIKNVYGDTEAETGWDISTLEETKKYRAFDTCFDIVNSTDKPITFDYLIESLKVKPKNQSNLLVE